MRHKTDSADLLAGPAPARALEVGEGRVYRLEDGIRLAVDAPDAGRYTNAQVDDYRQQGGGPFRWRPPLRLTVEARFSHDVSHLRGTAGFGFWNDPFGMTNSGRLRLPRTLWYFFGGPETDLPLAHGVAGCGWKAATLDACRWEALAVLPSAPLIVPMLHLPGLYRRLWPRVQRRLRIAEAVISHDLRVWHRYEIEWQEAQCRFATDGEIVLDAPFSPAGPMGLVAWIDNQFMVATPRGRFRHGVVAAEAQWLEIKTLRIDRPSA